MTTKSTKPVTRETSATVRYRGVRVLIATIHHGMLILRVKGCKQKETLDLSACYSLGVKQRIAEERALKRKKKS